MGKLQDVKSSLPEQEDSISRFFEGCEKRKRFVTDTPDHYKKHLAKAKHDLARATAEFEDECWDWTVVKAYYAIHHGGNAILSKHKNIFSKDHSCLIIALKQHQLIDASLFEELMELYDKFSDTLSLDLTFQLRKISQYNVDEWDGVTKEDAEMVLGVAKKFIKFVEGKV